MFQVYFTDYGNVEEINTAHLAQLPTHLETQPEYAIQASLNGITPSTGSQWSNEANETFSDMVIVSSCQVEAVGKDDSSTHLVNLLVNGVSVGKTLVESKLIFISIL